MRGLHAELQRLQSVIYSREQSPAVTTSPRLEQMVRHARGFLGWGDKVGAHSLEYIPATAVAAGNLPTAGAWSDLEISLDQLGCSGKLVDGVAFLHDGGRAWLADTRLIAPDGVETVVFGEQEDRTNPRQLEQVQFAVAGLKAGTAVRVLFEDREITAAEGSFSDNLSGEDLYQRYGGERTGYGNSPVAVRVHEIADYYPRMTLPFVRCRQSRLRR